MMHRLRVSAIILLCLSTANAVGETPTAPPLAVFDEATLRQAGVETEAGGLLAHLDLYLRTDGDPDKIKTLIAQLGHTQFEQRERAARQLLAVGRPALEPLRQAHKKHADPEVRHRAGHCVAVLESKLDPNVTMSAVRRLIYLRAGGAAERLLALLPVVDWEIQDEIFHGLPRVALRDGKLDPALLAALEDQSALRRAAAALAVALHGNGDERGRVRKLLTDRDAHVRLRTAQGLLAVHDAASLPVLIELLNEPLVEISWSAEELLHWVARNEAPTVSVGAASEAECKKAVDAWTVWHRKWAGKIDWKQIEATPGRPGLYLLCEDKRVWLCGCDGKQRWWLERGAHDVVLLPGNHILYATFHTGNLIQCDLTAKVDWYNCKDWYQTCQRLPNGNLFVTTSNSLIEMTSEGEAVSQVPIDLEVHDAWQLRTGRILCRHRYGVCEIDRFSGRKLRGGTVEGNDQNEALQTFAVLPDGRCVLAIPYLHRILEVNADGQTLNARPVYWPKSVEALRNGHCLVSTWWLPRVLELDAEGRTLWEVNTPNLVVRIRAVLNKVCIGFDKPRQADFNLDSVAHRIRCLNNPNEDVRYRAASLLAELRPTDEESLAALTAALDDVSVNVRSAVHETMAKIGEPAVPWLIQTLKTGTNKSRKHAVKALQEIGPSAKDAVPELINLVKDHQSSLELRDSAVIILGQVGPKAKAAIPILLAVAQSTKETEELRIDALNSLGAIGREPATVVPPLIDILKDTKESPMVRCVAARNLSCFDSDAKPAVPVIRDLLRNPNLPSGLGSAMVDVLASVDQEGVPTLVIAINESNPETRCYAIALMTRFITWHYDARDPIVVAVGQACNDPNEQISDYAKAFFQELKNRHNKKPPPVI